MNGEKILKTINNLKIVLKQILMTKPKTIIEVLNALKVTKVGNKYVAPGVRIEGTYEPKRVKNYPGNEATEFVSRMECEGKSISVLTESGVAIELDTTKKELVVVKPLTANLEELRSRAGPGYTVVWPREHDDETLQGENLA